MSQDKETQKKLIIEIMEADAKDGLYKQQTAMQELISWGDEMLLKHPQKLLSFGEAIDKAVSLLEKEKEQIEDAFQEGKWDWNDHLTKGEISKDLAKYYNEKYGKK